MKRQLYGHAKKNSTIVCLRCPIIPSRPSAPDSTDATPVKALSKTIDAATSPCCTTLDAWYLHRKSGSTMKSVISKTLTAWTVCLALGIGVAGAANPGGRQSGGFFLLGIPHAGNRANRATVTMD
jgi:hypothetical protein